eukprot:scaffold16217_cov69-Skeletonema_menzelii.AAC.1
MARRTVVVYLIIAVSVLCIAIQKQAKQGCWIRSGGGGRVVSWRLPEAHINWLRKPKYVGISTKIATLIIERKEKSRYFGWFGM